MANKIVLQGVTQEQCNADFLAGLKENYSSEVQFIGKDSSNGEEAAKAINEWCSQQTNGKIKKLLDVVPVNCRLVLLNAVYFKSLWDVQFKKQLTSTLPFTMENGTTKQVPMMHMRREKLPYVSTQEFEAVELFYKYRHWSLVLVLPKKNKFENIGDFIKTAKEKNLLEKLLTSGENGAAIGFTKEITVLALPRFKIETDANLDDTLKGQGMAQMYGGGLGNMIPDDNSLKVGTVIHKAVIEVNEEGTEAAAATAVMVMATCYIPPTNMEFDRPFMFILRHVPSKIVAFMGVVHEPKE